MHAHTCTHTIKSTLPPFLFLEQARHALAPGFLQLLCPLLRMISTRCTPHSCGSSLRCHLPSDVLADQPFKHGKSIWGPHPTSPAVLLSTALTPGDPLRLCSLILLPAPSHQRGTTTSKGVLSVLFSAASPVWELCLGHCRRSGKAGEWMNERTNKCSPGLSAD